MWSDTLRYHIVALKPREASANLMWLKLAAMAAMLLDHTAAAYLQLWPSTALEHFLHMPGRISIPIFAFLVAYGYANFSSNRVHYALRLWLFAAISEPAYIAFFGRAGNALFPLALGVTALLLIDGMKGKLAQFIPLTAIGMTLFFSIALNEMSILPITLLVWLFHRAILADRKKRLAWCIPIAFTVMLSNKLEWQYFVMVPATLGLIAAALAFRGRLPVLRIGKWVGYGFYPAHLVGLALVVHALSP